MASEVVAFRKEKFGEYPNPVTPPAFPLHPKRMDKKKVGQHSSGASSVPNSHELPNKFGASGPRPKQPSQRRDKHHCCPEKTDILAANMVQFDSALCDSDGAEADDSDSSVASERRIVLPKVRARTFKETSSKNHNPDRRKTIPSADKDMKQAVSSAYTSPVKIIDVTEKFAITKNEPSSAMSRSDVLFNAKNRSNNNKSFPIKTPTFLSTSFFSDAEKKSDKFSDVNQTKQQQTPCTSASWRGTSSIDMHSRLGVISEDSTHKSNHETELKRLAITSSTKPHKFLVKGNEDRKTSSKLSSQSLNKTSACSITPPEGNKTSQRETAAAEQTDKGTVAVPNGMEARTKVWTTPNSSPQLLKKREEGLSSPKRLFRALKKVPKSFSPSLERKASSQSKSAPKQGSVPTSAGLSPGAVSITSQTSVNSLTSKGSEGSGNGDNQMSLLDALHKKYYPDQYKGRPVGEGADGSLLMQSKSPGLPRAAEEGCRTAYSVPHGVNAGNLSDVQEISPAEEEHERFKVRVVG